MFILSHNSCYADKALLVFLVKPHQKRLTRPVKFRAVNC